MAVDLNVKLSAIPEVDKDAFAQYGVKGMKWGVVREALRRKTPEERLQKLADKDAKGEKNDALKRKRVVDLSKSKDAKDAKFIRNKAKISGLETLSNKDLTTAIRRMNLEVTYNNLKYEQSNQSIIGQGKQFLGEVAKGVFVNAASSWVSRPGSGSPVRVRSYVGNPNVIQGSVVRKSLDS